MEVTVMLCDAVQAHNRKLFILGGGWTNVDCRMVPVSLAVIVRVPWSECNVEHELKVELRDEDGQLVTPKGKDKPAQMSLNFEAGRPPGMPQGADSNATLTIGGHPLHLDPGKSYCWNIEINGELLARAPFTTRRQR